MGKAPKGFSCCSNSLPRAWPLHTLPGAPVPVSRPIVSGLPGVEGGGGAADPWTEAWREAKEKQSHEQKPGGGQPGVCEQISPKGASALALLTLPGLQLCQMPSTEHGMGHTGGLGCLWPSLSSGTITPGVPLGPGQARPWGKHSVTGKSSRRRKPAAGSSQGGRQRSPGCGEQRRVCRARRALSAPSVAPRPLQVCLGRGCPPVPRHTRPR